MRLTILIAAIILTSVVVTASGQDVLSVGDGNCAAIDAGGTTVTIPIYVRDIPGTPLDRGKAQSSIGAFSVMIEPSPLSAIAMDTEGKLEVHFARAGVTETAETISDGEFRTADSASYYFQTGPAQSMLMLSLDASAPGDLVAMMTVTLAEGLPSGTRIDLRLEPDMSVLSNRFGTRGQSGRDATLRLLDGCVEIK